MTRRGWAHAGPMLSTLAPPGPPALRRPDPHRSSPPGSLTSATTTARSSAPSTSRSRPARPSASSAATAPARRRPSNASRASAAPTPASVGPRARPVAGPGRARHLRRQPAPGRRPPRPPPRRRGPRALRGLVPGRGRRRIEPWGLAERAGTPFADLSGGQRQRLFVALALIHEPEVVFLDEVTQGLDPAARRSVWRAIDHIRDRGTTVVLVSHVAEEIEALCDRVAVMDHGRIVDTGTPREITDHHARHTEVRFTTPSGFTPAPSPSCPASTRFVTTATTPSVVGTSSMVAPCAPPPSTPPAGPPTSRHPPDARRRPRRPDRRNLAEPCPPPRPLRTTTLPARPPSACSSSSPPSRCSSCS